MFYFVIGHKWGKKRLLHLSGISQMQDFTVWMQGIVSVPESSRVISVSDEETVSSVSINTSTVHVQPSDR